MPRSWARGYVEPIAALAAVLAVVVGLTLYAETVDDAHQLGDRSVAETVLEELRRDALVDGVIQPDRLRTAEPPTGWRVNVTLASPRGRWSRGHQPPASADTARRTVALWLGTGEIGRARLTVHAWR